MMVGITDKQALEKENDEERLRELSKSIKKDLNRLLDNRRLYELRDEEALKAALEDVRKKSKDYADSFTKSERGEKITHLQQVISLTDHSLGEATLGYASDFTACVTEMVKNSKAFGKLLRAWMKESGDPTRFSGILPGIAQTLGVKKEDCVHWFNDLIGNNPEIALPKLQYSINFQNGKMNFTSLTASIRDKIADPMRQEAMEKTAQKIDENFKQAVGIWLSAQKIEGRNNTWYHEGVELTPEKFNALKNDPVNGLEVTLQKGLAGLPVFAKSEPESKSEPDTEADNTSNFTP